MPWQFGACEDLPEKISAYRSVGALGLTEDGGNRVIKYTDELLNGASPNDGKSRYTHSVE